MGRGRRRGAGVLALVWLFTLGGGLTTALAEPGYEDLRPRWKGARTAQLRFVTVTPPKQATKGGCPVAPALPTAPVTAAHALGRSVTVYSAPDGSQTHRLANPTRDHQRLHLRVLEQRRGWLHVMLPVRPNGTTGWIRTGDVSRSGVPTRILVEKCAKRLTLFRGDEVLMRETVAIGKPASPTPAGEFYVDFTFRFQPFSAAYGPAMISVAGFSEVLKSFHGAIPQIAIHGTRAQWSIGKPASNGCVRMRNDAAVALSQLVLPGTPVTIVA